MTDSTMATISVSRFSATSMPGLPFRFEPK